MEIKKMLACFPLQVTAYILGFFILISLLVSWNTTIEHVETSKLGKLIDIKHIKSSEFIKTKYQVVTKKGTWFVYGDVYGSFNEDVRMELRTTYSGSVSRFICIGSRCSFSGSLDV